MLFATVARLTSQISRLSNLGLQYGTFLQVPLQQCPLAYSFCFFGEEIEPALQSTHSSFSFTLEQKPEFGPHSGEQPIHIHTFDALPEHFACRCLKLPFLFRSPLNPISLWRFSGATTPVTRQPHCGPCKLTQPGRPSQR